MEVCSFKTSSEERKSLMLPVLLQRRLSPLLKGSCDSVRPTEIISPILRETVPYNIVPWSAYTQGEKAIQEKYHLGVTLEFCLSQKGGRKVIGKTCFHLEECHNWSLSSEFLSHLRKRKTKSFLPMAGKDLSLVNLLCVPFLWAFFTFIQKNSLLTLLVIKCMVTPHQQEIPGYPAGIWEVNSILTLSNGDSIRLYRLGTQSLKTVYPPHLTQFRFLVQTLVVTWASDQSTIGSDDPSSGLIYLLEKLIDALPASMPSPGLHSHIISICSPVSKFSKLRLFGFFIEVSLHGHDWLNHWPLATDPTYSLSPLSEVWVRLKVPTL